MADWRAELDRREAPDEARWGPTWFHCGAHGGWCGLGRGDRKIWALGSDFGRHGSNRNPQKNMAVVIHSATVLQSSPPKFDPTPTLIGNTSKLLQLVETRQPPLELKPNHLPNPPVSSCKQQEFYFGLGSPNGFFFGTSADGPDGPSFITTIHLLGRYRWDVALPGVLAQRVILGGGQINIGCWKILDV